jgi:hypothetical protein
MIVGRGMVGHGSGVFPFLARAETLEAPGIIARGRLG